MGQFNTHTTILPTFAHSYEAISPTVCRGYSHPTILPTAFVSQRGGVATQSLNPQILFSQDEKARLAT